jgi:hypothetical protein
MKLVRMKHKMCHLFLFIDFEQYVNVHIIFIPYVQENKFNFFNTSIYNVEYFLKNWILNGSMYLYDSILYKKCASTLWVLAPSLEDEIWNQNTTM